MSILATRYRLDTKRALSLRDIDAPSGNKREAHAPVGQLNGKYARNVIVRSINYIRFGFLSNLLCSSTFYDHTTHLTLLGESE